MIGADNTRLAYLMIRLQSFGIHYAIPFSGN